MNDKRDIRPGDLVRHARIQPEDESHWGVVISIKRGPAGLDRGMPAGFKHAVEVMYSDGSIQMMAEALLEVINKEKE
jgi:hypothetical protein